MQFWVIIKIALRGLLANKMRSFLTMLGVIIGVGSVIAMVAIGEGAKLQVTRQIASMGVTTLSIRPGMRGSFGARTGDSQTLTVEDAEAVERDVPGVVGVAPEVSSSAQVVYGNRTWRARVVCTTEDYLYVRAYQIEKGRIFTKEDDLALRQYCVLGPQIVQELFAPDESPLGKEVKLSGKIFIVVGVMQAKGDLGFFNPDNQMYVPLQVGMKRLFGATSGAANSLQAVHVRYEDSDYGILEKMAAHERVLERFMRQKHKTPYGEPSDFSIRGAAEYLRQTEETGRTFTVLLAGVAGISLLVGGIGIMNIMLVTVTERTREIGIRKALGARPWDILKQFVIEAVVVSLLGGAVGIAAGLGAAHLIPKLPDWFPDVPKFETAPTGPSIILAFCFAAVIGVFFGYYPARKAAKLDPIEALRYE
jgi:putative ABC transport system permease protein